MFEHSLRFTLQSICPYCGRRDRFLHKRHHNSCYEQHTRFGAMVPQVFQKALESNVAGTHFAELLQSMAAACFVSPDELSKIAVIAIRNIIAELSQERIPPLSATNRLAEIVYACDRLLRTSEFHETMVKLAVLGTLEIGQVPNLICVSGGLPMKFEGEESLLWIFNRVDACFTSEGLKENVLVSRALIPVLRFSYLQPANVSSAAPSSNELIRRSHGDLAVTTKNLYFLSEEHSRTRIAVGKILRIGIGSDGVCVQYEGRKEKNRMFLVDDPWFLANLIGLLCKLAREEPISDSEVDTIRY